MHALAALLKRDMLLAWRAPHAAMALAFFFLAITLVPFGVGADLILLQKLSTGLVWVGLVLSLLLSLENMFRGDLEDGSFDQLLLAAPALELLCLTKAFAHWLAIGVPLVLAAPLAGLLLNIAPQNLPALCLALLATSPALSFLGMVGSALAAGVRRGGLLAALLVMPLYVPLLIFGQAAFLDMQENGFSAAPSAPLAILLLFALAAILLAPLAAAAALRVRLQ